MEVAAFSEEEGVRLRVPSTGSSAPVGKVDCTLDLRHADDGLRRVLGELPGRWSGLTAAPGLSLGHELLSEFPAVPVDAGLPDLLGRAAGVVFLRSPGGLSHHPDEAVLKEDVRDALWLGPAFLRHLGRSQGGAAGPLQPLHHTRPHELSLCTIRLTAHPGGA